LFKNHLATAKRLVGEDLANRLLPKIDCCSDTEEDNEGKYHSVLLFWRSEIYSKFLHNLDNNSLNYLSEMKNKNQAKRSVEYDRSYDNVVPDYETKACESLPVNCYCSSFIQKLTWTDKLILELKPNEEKLEHLTKNLETTRWFE